MKIMIEPRADNWFKENVGIREGCGIRFKARLYGTSAVREGYALAFETNQPVGRLGAQLTSKNGILFYVEEDDLWFFDGHDLTISYNETLDEPQYIYLKKGQAINKC